MTPRNQALLDRINMIATETIRQLNQALSVEQYIRAEEGDSDELADTRWYATQLRSAIGGVKAQYTVEVESE